MNLFRIFIGFNKNRNQTYIPMNYSPPFWRIHQNRRKSRRVRLSLHSRETLWSLKPLLETTTLSKSNAYLCVLRHICHLCLRNLNFFLLFLYFKLKQNDSFCKSDHKNTVDRIAKHTHISILLSKISTLNQTTANKENNKKRSHQSNIGLLFHQQKTNFLSLIAMNNPRHILSKMIRFLICHDIYTYNVYIRSPHHHTLTHLISTATLIPPTRRKVALSLIYIHPSLSLSLSHA